MITAPSRRQRTTALLEAIDRYLEAVRPVQAVARKERALGPLIRQYQPDIAAAFQAQGAAFLKRFATLRSQFNEAISPADWGPLFTQTEMDTLAVLLKPITELQSAALNAGVRYAIADLELGGSFKLPQPRAVAFLRQQGADRVTMINQTTRDRMRSLITQAVDEGWSYTKTAKAIKDRFDGFAGKMPQQHIRDRAELVAVTEAGDAYEEGAMQVGHELVLAGLVMEKSWLTVGDDRVDGARCAANHAQGWILLDQAFQSGHQRPLAHPACRCTILVQRRKQEQSQPSVVGQTNPQIMGHTWWQGALPTVADAVAVGNGPDGWIKHEAILRNDYLPRFDLTDDVEWTIGLWGSPEPSFNTVVQGLREKVIEMAKAWGKDFNQEAMVMLLPSPNGAGGYVSWRFGRVLTEKELDNLLGAIRATNEQLAAGIAKTIGVHEDFRVGLTVKDSRRVEFWASDFLEAKAARNILDAAIAKAGLDVPKARWNGGYDFLLLFRDDY